MPVFSLTRDYHDMPDIRQASKSGLVAVSLDIHPQRIVAGYQAGLFPWFQNNDGLYHWYSPNPRSVLYTDKLVVHKSMRSIFNQDKFEYSFDRAFLQVLDHCRSVKRREDEYGGGSTWLNSSFLRSYNRLHEIGIGHSVEVWQNDKLVGGLYGLALGRLFFGESMFSLVPNASKAGFITLVQALRSAGYLLVDCQQDSNHLRTLGSTPITVDAYLRHLIDNRQEPTNLGHWEYLPETGTLQVVPIENTEGVSGG